MTPRDHLMQGMIGLLPEGKCWTKAERGRWLGLLVRIIDYTIAVVPSTCIPEEVKPTAAPGEGREDAGP